MGYVMCCALKLPSEAPWEEKWHVNSGPMSGNNEAEIRRRLGEDPWARVERLVITSAEPWMLVVGAERLGR